MLANIGLAQKQISYVTPKKDTLFLEKNNIGYTIKQTWDLGLFKEEPVKPVIVMVDDISIITDQRKKKINGKKK